MAKFGTIFFPGLFDRLHEGHEFQFNWLKGIDCERIVVLVGSDKRILEVGKKLHSLTQNQGQRVKDIAGLLKKLGLSHKTSVEIIDGYPNEQVVSAGNRDGIVFEHNKENKKVMRIINTARKQRGLRPLRVIMHARKSPNSGPVSSTVHREKLHSILSELSGMIQKRSKQRRFRG